MIKSMKTTFDTLPQQIDFLLAEVLEVKEIILKKIGKPEEIPKYLNLDGAILFLSKKAYPISKSKMYKLTSSNAIPFHRAGNSLLFHTEELEKWFDDQIDKQGKGKLLSGNPVIKRTQSKMFNKINKK